MKRSKSFLGKTVVISGSSKGIGRELARILGAMGANLVINGLNAEVLNKTYQEFKSLGYSVMAIRGNVADMRDCYVIAEAAVKRFGSIDAVIANAGVKTTGSIESLSPEAIKQIMDVNYLGTVYLIKACLPHLKKCGGNILITGSASGFRGIPGAGVYTASKMALTALADSLRIELINTGVNISLAYVGFTQNDPVENNEVNTSPSSSPKKLLAGKVATQKSVAIRMIKMMQYNKFKRTFSLLGKTNEWITRLFPGLGNYILRRYYLNAIKNAS